MAERKDAVAQMIWMMGGNFRQMERLLSQMKRIIEMNPEVEVVEAARVWEGPLAENRALTGVLREA